jgi:glycolate oxidase FAD binding subunit
MHDLLTEWSERIRAAAAAGQTLRIRGGGSKDFYGALQKGPLLETTQYAGIVDYEPTELVLTARAGTLLKDIEAALGKERQMLAFEPPHYGPHATVGGTVACGLSGPRRPFAGAARDFVLGVRLLDGRGQSLAFGGRVMKNVAGYDVSRLMVGAMGTLGVLLEVSLKVLPRPQHERTLRFEADQEEAIRRMNAWAGKPYPLSATCHEAGILSIRLSGAEAGVEAAARHLGGEAVAVAEADSYWHAVKEHRHPFFKGTEPLWRIAVKSTSAPLPLPGSQFTEWNGALRWIRTDADVQQVRAAARKAGGHAIAFRGFADPASTFHPLPPPLRPLHARLKDVFDPARIFNRGRLYPDL